MAPLRYTIPVPERTRVIWASQAAKDLWAPRIHRINAAWTAVERESVGQFRVAARQSVAPDELPALSSRTAEAGRGLLVLGQQPVAAQYASRSAPLAPGQPFAYNVIIAQDTAAARAFALAHKGNDDVTMGDLLGYPPCCIAFFQRAWNQERWMDTTWPMSGEGENHRVFEHVHSANNVLLRWLGVRMVPHLPCSFTCKGTQAFGFMFGKLLDARFPQECHWMWELLSADVEWNAMKGTAEVRLPILKIATTTDPLTEPVSVRLKGRVELEASARGHVFPWKETNIASAIAPMVFHKDVWSDNGFASKEAMAKAHDAIVAFFEGHDLLGRRVLDLGCGNGLLLERLTDAGVGVESDAKRAEQAEKRVIVHQTTIGEFVRTNDGAFDVVLYARQRVQEMSEDGLTIFREWLRRHASTVVSYDYTKGDCAIVKEEVHV